MQIRGKKLFSLETVSRSAFQNVCGDKITGAAPCTAATTAESEFLLIRKMNGCLLDHDFLHAVERFLSFLASLEDACARISLVDFRFPCRFRSFLLRIPLMSFR